MSATAPAKPRISPTIQIMIGLAARQYVENGERFRTLLRRID